MLKTRTVRASRDWVGIWTHRRLVGSDDGDRCVNEALGRVIHSAQQPNAIDVTAAAPSHTRGTVNKTMQVFGI